MQSFCLNFVHEIKKLKLSTADKNDDHYISKFCEHLKSFYSTTYSLRPDCPAAISGKHSREEKSIIKSVKKVKISGDSKILPKNQDSSVKSAPSFNVSSPVTHVIPSTYIKVNIKNTIRSQDIPVEATSEKKLTSLPTSTCSMPLKSTVFDTPPVFNIKDFESV